VVDAAVAPPSQQDVAERIARAVSGQLGYGDAQNISVMIDATSG